MSEVMTLDELLEIYLDSSHCMNSDDGEERLRSYRAGIHAVVTALRDEIVDKTTHYAWTGNEIFNAFEEILAPREGGKAEHVADGDEGPSLHQTPAADNLPRVQVTNPFRGQAMTNRMSARDVIAEGIYQQ